MVSFVWPPPRSSLPNIIISCSVGTFASEAWDDETVRMSDRKFDCIEVFSSRNYSSKYISSISKFGFFVLLTSYSFGSVVYADDARDLFSSVVFCPIIRSVPWFASDSVHRETDVL